MSQLQHAAAARSSSSTPQLCHLFKPKTGPAYTPSLCGAARRGDQPVHPFSECSVEHQQCAVCVELVENPC